MLMDIVKIHYWVSATWRYKEAITVTLITPESPRAIDIDGFGRRLKIVEN